MNISCDVCRDLLPLYAEDMVSPDSRELVDNHLCGCDGCTKELAALKKKEPIPAVVEAESLNNVKKAIRRRRVLTVMAAVLTVCTLYCGFMEFWNADICILADVAIERVERTEEDGIRIYTNPIVNGALMTWGHNGDSVAYLATARMHNVIFPKNRENRLEEYTPVGEEHEEMFGEAGLPGKASDQNYWYVNIQDGTADRALWVHEGAETPVGPIIEVNYYLYYYCGGLALAAAALALIGKLLKKPWARMLCWRLAGLCISLSIGTVLTCGGQLIDLTDMAVWKMRDGTIVALPMTLAINCYLQLWKLKQQDSAV